MILLIKMANFGYKESKMVPLTFSFIRRVTVIKFFIKNKSEHAL